MTSLPPVGMASRALMHKFMMTCSICVGSALIGGSGAVTTFSSMSLPITRSKKLTRPVAQLFRSISRG